MQTEWSRANDDRPAEVSSEQPPWGQPAPAAPSIPAADLDGSDDVAEVPESSDTVEQVPVSAAAAEAEDAPEELLAPGEEELHRSAVEAVDGLLDEVELALTRLDDGTYGRCEECGEPIDDDRLAELPIIRTCAGCAATGEGDRSEAPLETSAPATPGILADRGEAVSPATPWSSGV